MVRVLDAVEQDRSLIKGASDTSDLQELLMLNWKLDCSLCFSMSMEMRARWMCMDHYPVDQFHLINELNDIEGVHFDIKGSVLIFRDELDSSKVTRICEILSRGLRFYKVVVSNLKRSETVLQELTRSLNRASFVTIYYHRYMSDNPSESDKLNVKGVLRSCIDIITENVQLKNIVIGIVSKSSQGTDGIVDSMKYGRNLRSIRYGLQLDVRDMSKMMSMMVKSQTLTELALQNNKLACESVQLISKLIQSNQTLTSVELWATAIPDDGMKMIVEAVCANPIMKKLRVASSNLSDESAPFIARLLQSCSSLTSLDVAFNRITVIGARMIFEQLETNRTLLHFNISHNDLSIDHATKTMKCRDSVVGAGELIARMLVKNTTLCTLNIGSIKISDNDVRPIAEALMNNRTLAHLSLGGDRFISTSCKQIMDVLHWKSSLIGTDLDFSRLDEGGMQKLGEILQKNSKLRFLKLDHCDIDHNKLCSVAERMKSNRCLTHLSFSSNELGSAGVETLADIVSVNRNIIYLDVRWNRIGDDGVKRIAPVLAGGCSLAHLDIQYNDITDTGAETLVKALKSNDTLIHLSILDGNSTSRNIVKRLRSLRRALIIV